ncbi:MAG: dihydrodipicolinate synthase family protein, partial [Actinomycetota bacterium]|nr:dihydrodipicolinate synthase family protein [Actinomycetota bacterium]
ITPIDKNERVDVTTLRRHLDRLIPHVDGVMALGTSGEFSMLSDNAADEVANEVINQVAGRVPVIVGVGDTSTARVQSHVQRAERAGADYVSACCPYYYQSTPAALRDHFLRIAEDSSIPLILYNIPRNTVNSLEHETVKELSGHENIVGIKDSSGDMIYFSRLLALRSPTFSVLQGASERVASASWSIGMDGYISGLENIAPGAMARIAAAVAAGNKELTAAEQRKMDLLSSLTDHGYWLSALKYAASLLSGGSGRTYQPLPVLTTVDQAAIKEILSESGLR